ncbi:uncharacterized protein V1518DRAFT_409681 [Limtongia smithiae]|uniref:uncharacterized protein n=1 Tax=Limtongia smithiae TaxID=1125753 RepID=UPI0034CD7E53
MLLRIREKKMLRTILLRGSGTACYGCRWLHRESGLKPLESGASRNSGRSTRSEKPFGFEQVEIPAESFPELYTSFALKKSGIATRPRPSGEQQGQRQHQQRRRTDAATRNRTKDVSATENGESLSDTVPLLALSLSQAYKRDRGLLDLGDIEEESTNLSSRALLIQGNELYRQATEEAATMHNEIMKSYTIATSYAVTLASAEKEHGDSKHQEWVRVTIPGTCERIEGDSLTNNRQDEDMIEYIDGKLHEDMDANERLLKEYYMLPMLCALSRFFSGRVNLHKHSVVADSSALSSLTHFFSAIQRGSESIEPGNIIDVVKVGKTLFLKDLRVKMAPVPSAPSDGQRSSGFYRVNSMQFGSLDMLVRFRVDTKLAPKLAGALPRNLDLQYERYTPAHRTVRFQFPHLGFPLQSIIVPEAPQVRRELARIRHVTVDPPEKELDADDMKLYLRQQLVEAAKSEEIVEDVYFTRVPTTCLALMLRGTTKGIVEYLRHENQFFADYETRARPVLRSVECVIELLQTRLADGRYELTVEHGTQGNELAVYKKGRGREAVLDEVVRTVFTEPAVGESAEQAV